MQHSPAWTLFLASLSEPMFRLCTMTLVSGCWWRYGFLLSISFYCFSGGDTNDFSSLCIFQFYMWFLVQCYYQMILDCQNSWRFRSYSVYFPVLLHCHQQGSLSPIQSSLISYLGKRHSWFSIFDPSLLNLRSMFAFTFLMFSFPTSVLRPS